MIAVCGDHHIGWFKGHHRPNRNSFLTNVQVTKTPDLSHPLHFGALFLETPSEDHLIEHRPEKAFVGLSYGLQLGFSTSKILTLGEFNDREIVAPVFSSFF